MHQRGGITLGNVCALALFVGGIYMAWFYLPHYFVRYKMDKLVIETLDVWKETDSEQKAKEFLHYQVRRKKIPDYIKKTTCTLKKMGLQRHMTCEWDVLVKDNILEDTLLEFKVYKYLDSDGLLEDVD